MEFQKIFKFLRFTFQGICIASWGTMGVTPSWGGFVLGLVAFIVSLTLACFEKGD